jgi:hypothetical protein
MSLSYTWQTILNPFQHSDGDAGIIGHISGRSSDIVDMIAGSQSAIILSGSPSIGKTTLIRYLCKGETKADTRDWSWKKELVSMGLEDAPQVEDFHFVQVNLNNIPWTGTAVSEAMANPKLLLEPFIQECISALAPFPPSATSDTESSPNDLNALQNRLNELQRKNKNARYFLILDTIERLALPSLDFSGQTTSAETQQEQGLALLDRCGVIRLLVDLIDNYPNFGVILSLQALPRPRSTDQFVHVSADLARFTTIPLQILSYDDAKSILAQPLKALSPNEQWLAMMHSHHITTLFTEPEQQWLVQQAGTHPYLLQQLCFYTFYYKCLFMATHSPDAHWPTLGESDKQRISELVNERISTFLTRLWKRLSEALEAHAETRTSFYELLKKAQASDINTDRQPWQEIKEQPELRYLLSSEGIIRYEFFNPVIPPGTIIRDYLLSKINESSPSQSRGFWLTLTCSGKEPELLSLSELEYHLIKTLLQHPKRCTEEELMKSAWGKVVERSTFTQRMHHLRKKLRDHCDNKDPITNHYGGQYSLAHPEWLHLDEK